MGHLNRRSFLTRAAAGVSTLALATAANLAVLEAEESKPSALSFPPLKKKYRAAAVGSTGHGDFGHGIDLALVGLPGVEFVAIADDDATGLKEAGKRCQVARLYDDYRTMLEKEKVDLVTVCMRHVDRHEEIVTHCAAAGKHVYTEKPVAADLMSFDRMVAACDKAGVKLGVGLPNHVSPAIREALSMVRDGKFGTLRALRAQGNAIRGAAARTLSS
ncbi:MAG: Gfo/Idh/MocA family oxidoreductase [Pirellulales bacterium]